MLLQTNSYIVPKDSARNTPVLSRDSGKSSDAWGAITSKPTSRSAQLG